MSLSENAIRGIIETLPLKTMDDSMGQNAKAADNVGLEVKVSRKYDGVGLSKNRKCQWCLDRECSNLPYKEAYARGVFQRHENCHCEIEYVSAKGEISRQTRKGGRDRWEKVDEKEERIQKDTQEQQTAAGFLVEACKKNSIEYNEVKKLERQLTDGEIIAKIGGGDKTVGSCSSLTLSFIANQNGFDVRDFRGGNSCNLFSRGGNIKRLLNEKGVVGFTGKDYNGFKSLNQVLSCMEPGKTYGLWAAKHSAIIRKLEDGTIEYLELQTEKQNGFHKLTTSEAKRRFGVTKSKSFYGQKVMQESIMIESTSLANVDSFQEVLGYINTEAGKQLKGVGGRAK